MINTSVLTEPGSVHHPLAGRLRRAMHTIFPDKAAFLELARRGNIIPVCTDLLGDFETPVSAYAKLKDAGPAYLLESISGGDRLSRYSFIGCRPRKVFSFGEAVTRVTGADGSVAELPTPADPLRMIEAEFAGLKPVTLPGMPPFTGGAVGYLGYEYASRIETTVPAPGRDEQGVPLACFMLSDSLIVFDRAKQTVRLCVNAHVTGDPSAAYDRAAAELGELIALLRSAHVPETPPMPAPAPVQVPPSNFTRGDFERAVDACKEYIRAGDVIQVVLSQCFKRPFGRRPLDLYRALRTVNPSPYMFLFEAGDFALVGASPEVHVRLTQGLVEIRPIAGTRPRGGTVAEDHALEKELLSDGKECAEHLMLVDLARNDIGRVCEYGTISVPEYMIVERYSHVMHIVSQVEGRLREGATAFDLMRATFPAGTVSGAPKVRAMQIIAGLEPTRRGFYAGALGYFGYDGSLDSCITLRTALLRNGTVYIQSGAGLVADSVPANEYQETVNKATAMLRAVDIADRL